MARAPRFYVATDYARKADARALADELEEIGMECAARWCTSQPTYKDDGGLGGELAGSDAANALKVAVEDLEDIASSDVFIQLTSGEKARGGRHVELGVALARALRDTTFDVLVVGPREHAFHYHPLVTVLDREQLLRWARTDVEVRNS